MSHIVQPAASIAAAASTALPPFAKVIAPAVAESGLPVIATQWLPCSGGFSVCAARGSSAWRGCAGRGCWAMAASGKSPSSVAAMAIRWAMRVDGMAIEGSRGDVAGAREIAGAGRASVPGNVRGDGGLRQGAGRVALAPAPASAQSFQNGRSSALEP